MDIDPPLRIGDKTFRNRFFMGTGKFASKDLMRAAIVSAGCELVTVALRRVDFEHPGENLIDFLPPNVLLMANTSGARDHREAVRIARIAREAGLGNFVKIEVISDARHLMPDNEETVKATEILAREGFTVLPYMMPDPMSARRLEEAGAACVMPLGSPIGSGQGLRARVFIEMILERSRVPVIVDAGIGKPSQACEAMELGADGVLANTAVAVSDDPIGLALAFSLAVRSGRLAHRTGTLRERGSAEASSPLTGFLR